MAQCNLCKKGNFVKIKTMVVADTQYDVLKCEKCNYEVARSQD